MGGSIWTQLIEYRVRVVMEVTAGPEGSKLIYVDTFY
jgi:hypothetical protein